MGSNCQAGLRAADESPLVVRHNQLRQGDIAGVDDLDKFLARDDIDLITVAFLVLQGFFFAGSPTAGEGSTAQRFINKRLVDAAHLLATEPVSVQLRYLQTLTEIGVEKNTTVVFPVPVDVFSGLQKLLAGSAKPATPAGG